MQQELDYMDRSLSMVVDYKKKIGFDGQILIEPKPKEPLRTSTTFTPPRFTVLNRYGLENEVRVNLEANHATLAGHTVEQDAAG